MLCFLPVREGKRALSSIDVQADLHMRQRRAREPIGRSSLHKLMRRKSTLAFLMTLPLLTLMVTAAVPQVAALGAGRHTW